MTNKGAMFGLDARIALAIFGALSVISGAALYSTIQNAKATSAITQMNEVGKAWEQLYLDTGKEIPTLHSAPAILRVDELIADKGTPGWNGPYLPFALYNGTDVWRLDTKQFGTAELTLANGSTTWVTTESPGLSGHNSECTSGSSCSIWIRFGAIPNNIIDLIDEQIDGSVDYTTGKIRVLTGGSNNRTYYKYADIKNPY